MPPRALVVEDDRNTRDALRAIIEGEGWIVDVAADGETAIEHLSELEYALILIDIVLPKMNGTDVMEHLEATNPSALENVVVVTGVATKDIAALFPAVRATLAKPVLPARLRATVKQYMLAWEASHRSSDTSSVA
ncbi:MAG: response regulator [Thermoanaerobaculia bacterium]|nr:response regulator [Thermoanaerobaculia bacterium]